MIQKVLLDTNIVIDLIDQRPGFENAARILQQNSDGKICACISFLSMANISYVLRKRNPGFTIPTLKQISSILTVLPMNDEQFQKALLMEGLDFEDILQAMCAVDNECECIVTRNVKDFQVHGLIKEAPRLLPVYSPQDYLDRFRE